MANDCSHFITVTTIRYENNRIVFSPLSVSAYGGGFPGFPPGFPHNPKLVCTERVIHLPFGRTITVPDCKVEKDKEFKDRLKEFIKRVRHGR